MVEQPFTMARPRSLWDKDKILIAEYLLNTRKPYERVKNIAILLQKSCSGVMILLLHGKEQYDIIAVQESWTNPHFQATYCSASCPCTQYTLVYITHLTLRFCRRYKPAGLRRLNIKQLQLSKGKPTSYARIGRKPMG